ncbi:MAG: phosphoglucomutase/phosphomannomutase family protein [Elusimicrobiota bacterium]
MATANIKFGASGWRAIIAEDFNLVNLRRVTHAVAEHIRENREYGYKGEEYLLHLKNSGRAAPKVQHVVVGYDTRYLSEEFAKNTAEAFAAEGLTVLFSNMDVPTPVVAWTVLKTFAAGGVTITASHDPAHYSGFKWTPYWGGPALPEVTNDLEVRIQGLTIAESDKVIPFDQAVSAGVIKVMDFHESYFKQLSSLLDAGAIKKAGLKVAADPMHGAARTYLRPALEKLGAKVTPLRENRDVLFGGRAPDTDEGNLKALRETVVKNRLNLGLACDCDGDRYGIIDSDGTWIPPNLVLGLALEHLVKNRGLKGKVARSLMTSHFTDSIARHYGLTVRETPVGFKHIGNLLRTGQYLIGGEESGGLSIMGHAPEKDGILACLLMAEMVAYERKPLKKILADLNKKVGNFVNSKISLRVDNGVNLAAVIEKLTHRPPLNLAGASVWRIDHTDGFKFIMKDGSWLGLRPTGTDPLVGIYAEASTKPRMDALIDSGKKIINGKF